MALSPRKRMETGQSTAYWTNICLTGKKNWGQIMEGLKFQAKEFRL